MPNVTITIPQPILTAGQAFKTRYRLLPSGAWSAYVSRTNAAFTLTGLAIGDYQLEVILVKADSTECAAVYKTFAVVAEYNCISFNSQIVNQGSLHYLQITYTLPGGFTNPPCGWEITYQQGSNKVTVPYATLPTGGMIKLQVPNQSLILTVTANLCNGNKKQCYAADVTGIPTPPCVPMAITDKRLIRDGDFWYLQFNFIQSSPATTSLYLHFKQIHPPGMGLLSYDEGKIPALTIAPGVTQVTLPISPLHLVLYSSFSMLTYNVFMIDNCGKQQFNIDYPL